MKRSFSLLMAIIFILVIGIIMALAIALGGSSVQVSTNRYFYEQAELIAKSATEYAVMSVQGHQIGAATGCVDTINFTYQNTFDVEVRVRYISRGLPLSCAAQTFANNVEHNESNATIIVDTRVTLTDSLLDATPPITYFRRTLQKL